MELTYVKLREDNVELNTLQKGCIPASEPSCKSASTPMTWPVAHSHLYVFLLP